MDTGILQIPGVELRFDEPMSRHTTFRVGGPVRCLARPKSERALTALLCALRENEVPFVVLGGGSNVVAPDGPWDAVVIQLRPAFGAIAEIGEAGEGEVLVHAGAGAKLATLVRFSIDSGLEGFEALSGIPGTVGGALVMNAGTPSASISDRLSWIEAIDSEGRKRKIERRDIHPQYRSMGLPAGCIVCGGCFRVRRAAPELLRMRAKEVLEKRKRSQPLRYPSAGSVFKNPPGHFAGALIEKAGLKGFRIGGAEISKKHANWIVNRGQALASDIVELVELMEKEIFATFGVRLEREIRILA